jgi:dienelactone hydrolase
MFRTALFAGLACCLLTLAGPLSAAHEVKTDTVTYQDGDVTLSGFLAVPADLVGKAPGVLVAHDWYGCGPYAQQRARELAERGYVAFALDMYGAGKVVSKSEEASALAGGFYKDLPLMVRRARAGLAVLTGNTSVDRSRVAAIGFCFGGTVALNLARSGDPLSGVVSFHGGLKQAAAVPAAEGAIKARILVLHGGADPFVPASDVAAFMEEMTKAKAVWRMEVYGGAVHSFSNPKAGDNVASGSAYNVVAEKLGIAAMERFFGEIFTVQ